MSAFDLYPAEAAAKLEGKNIDLSAPAGFFEGSLSAPLKGAAKGLLVEPARVLNLGMSFAPDMVDRALGTHTRDWWFENMMLERTSRKVTPNPRETGLAGQMLHALFDIGSQAVVAGPAGVLVSKTVGGAIEGVEQGLDVATAGKKGLIEGGAAAAGVALPIHLPPMVGTRIPALLQQLSYGVAANVPLGVAQRALTHQVLADAGYKDMAEQYKALDEGALLTDLVLGIAFGGLGHVLQAKGVKLGALNPSEVDAALAKRNAYHLEVDTAPGLARDGATRDAHVESVLKATEDLIEGRPVDISQTLDATNFEPNKPLDQARAAVHGETAKVIEPIARAADALQKADEAAATKQIELPIPPERRAQIDAVLKAEGIESTAENALQVEIISRARAIDAAAVDAIPLTLSDAAYLAKVQEVIDGNKATAQAGEAGKAAPGEGPGAKGGDAGAGPQGAKAAGRDGEPAKPSGEGTGHIDDAEVRAAESIAKQYPEMFVTMEDGTTISAHEAMAQANEVIAQAQIEAKAFEAAVNCALRVGG